MHVPAFGNDQRRLIRELRRAGPLPRSALSARLGLSPTALTKLSRELAAWGVIEEVAETLEQRRGRPAVPLRLAAGGGYAVGATAHKGMLDIALVDYAGATVATHHEQSGPLNPRDFARRVRMRTHELVDRHGLLGRRMLGIGVAVPGPPLSLEGDRWSVVDDMPEWRGADLREILHAELGWPLWIENDANTATIAEFYLGGLLREASTAVVLLFGYGIGAGVIVDGRLVRGQFGAAGEIGCLFPGDRPRPSPLDLLSCLRASGCEISSVADIDPTAEQQAAVIANWMDRAAQQLEVVCNTALAWLDPGAIVLAGPLPGAILRGIAERLRGADLATTVHDRKPPIRVSHLHGSPITLGAAFLPIHVSSAER
ncbi:ROK family transcriptional regulator [Sphingomonas xinjiangensis]|uniref:Putative NBD/HSP70 family sugar kinase n=1 Tax=Sphingomonas xinjiangensis TaxID=643568 RepID=A0A840YCC2_9SPHN|nr:ROK family transcriptional regulator [Sphingomonas xinjiangensis]MBB5711017.1 putative NBD/HSP70 family sugar kinase [Sphingomonas xinjiangensis]